MVHCPKKGRCASSLGFMELKHNYTKRCNEKYGHYQKLPKLCGQMTFPRYRVNYGAPHCRSVVCKCNVISGVWNFRLIKGDKWAGF